MLKLGDGRNMKDESCPVPQTGEKDKALAQNLAALFDDLCRAEHEAQAWMRGTPAEQQRRVATMIAGLMDSPAWDVRRLAKFALIGISRVEFMMGVERLAKSEVV